MKVSLGRIYQDRNFVVSNVNGQNIEKLFGLVSINDNDDEPIIVNLKLEGLKWQRFFLDAFLGFWEVSNEYIDEHDEKTIIVDYTKKYDLINKSVLKAECINGEITLDISDGSKLSLVLKNPTICDTESKLLYLNENT